MFGFISTFVSIFCDCAMPGQLWSTKTPRRVIFWLWGKCNLINSFFPSIEPRYFLIMYNYKFIVISILT